MLVKDWEVWVGSRCAPASVIAMEKARVPPRLGSPGLGAAGAGTATGAEGWEGAGAGAAAGAGALGAAGAAGAGAVGCAAGAQAVITKISAATVKLDLENKAFMATS